MDDSVSSLNAVSHDKKSASVQADVPTNLSPTKNLQLCDKKSASVRLKLYHYLEKTIHILIPPYFHFSGYGTIVINYSFQSGIQGKEHPNPGQSYGGTSRVAYLPNTPEGCEVLQLLRRAFTSRLVFTVGTSATTGLHNQITWNDIHHKTTTHGGPYGYGILMYVCLRSAMGTEYLCVYVC